MDYTEELAKEESHLLWLHMAKTGHSKQIAIGVLYKDGVLSKPAYTCSCPLCEYYFNKNAESHFTFDKYDHYVLCRGCMFHTEFGNCQLGTSPYAEWGFIRSRRATQAVADFIGGHK